MCLLALVGYCYLSIYCHVGWFIEAFSSGFHRDPDSKVNAGKAGVCVFVDTHTQTHRHRVKDLIFSTQGVLLEASHGDTADYVTVKVISHSTVWVQGKSVAPCRSLCKNPMNLPQSYSTLSFTPLLLFPVAILSPRRSLPVLLCFVSSPTSDLDLCVCMCVSSDERPAIIIMMIKIISMFSNACVERVQ